MNKILGINYSGFHDTSVALVDEKGNILNACSLERITREKQDGKTPDELLNDIDFNEIEEVIITTNKNFEKKEFNFGWKKNNRPLENSLKRNIKIYEEYKNARK